MGGASKRTDVTMIATAIQGIGRGVLKILLKPSNPPPDPCLTEDINIESERIFNNEKFLEVESFLCHIAHNPPLAAGCGYRH